jgi:protein gp37
VALSHPCWCSPSNPFRFCVISSSKTKATIAKTILESNVVHSSRRVIGVSDHSKIEWTEATWNPVRGCRKVSPGCKHCYAETFAERFRDVADHPYEHGFDPRLVPDKLLEPVRWSGARTVFVNSMSDLFQETVPDAYITAVATVMLRGNWHTYQVLTKRSDRMQRLLAEKLQEAGSARHIWWGVSVEDRKYGLPRIDYLRHAPASVRFLSIEPLLEDLGTINLKGIHWVIVGGESGPGARPMQKEWVESIRKQCATANVPFFFKQWGGVQKGKHGRQLNGRTYDDMPPRPAACIPSRVDRHAIMAELSFLTIGWPSTPLLTITEGLLASASSPSRHTQSSSLPSLPHRT